MRSRCALRLKRRRKCFTPWMPRMKSFALGLVSLCLLLCSCTRVKTVYVPTPYHEPIPAVLTEPLPELIACQTQRSNADMLVCRDTCKAVVQRCEKDRAALREPAERN